MQKDYLMRMMEQFIQSIASLILSRKAGNYEQALEQMQSISLKFLNHDITFFLKFTPEQLLDYFKTDTERCIICAGLLNELATISEEQKRGGEANHLKLMALNLYTHAIAHDKQFQTELYKEKAATLEEALKGKL